MIPLPHDASPSDVEQWCNRGVMMVRSEGGTWVPAWFRTVGRGRTVECKMLDSGDIITVFNSDVSVHWPMCGSVNLPGLHYAVHAARQTQRQYRRTWNVGGLNVVVPRAYDVSKWAGAVPGNMATPAEALAKACFNPEYPDLSTAEGMLNRGEKVSVAINPRLIMAGDRSGKRMFYYNGLLAATASDGILHAMGEAVPVRRLSKMLEGRYYGPSGF